MTKDQKIKGGKEMFSIFAAGMFERRVLHVHREQVAQERQLKPLRELEDEDTATKGGEDDDGSEEEDDDEEDENDDDSEQGGEEEEVCRSTQLIFH